MAIVYNPPTPTFSEADKSKWTISVQGGTLSSVSDIGSQSGTDSSPIAPTLNNTSQGFYSFGSSQEFKGRNETNIFTSSAFGSRNNNVNLDLVDYIAVAPGTSVTVTAAAAMHGYPGGSGDEDKWNGGIIGLVFYDADNVEILRRWVSRRFGNIGSDPEGSATMPRKTWTDFGVTAYAPENAVSFKVIAGAVAHNSRTTVYLKMGTLSYTGPRATLLVSSNYITTDADFYVRIGSTNIPTESVTSVTYYADNGVDPRIALGTNTLPPQWPVTASIDTEGTYNIYAELALDNGQTLTSTAVPVVVSDEPPPPPTTREYKASNSYTNLVMENIQGLGSQIPSTALVTGIELEVDYDMVAISRTRDPGLQDVTQSNADVIFDIANTGVFEVSLLNGQDGTYTTEGAPFTTEIPLVRTDFSIVESGTSEGKKWTMFRRNEPESVVLGDDDQLFGVGTIPVTDFVNRAIALRFYPIFGTKPSYTAEGDGAFRVMLDRVRVKLYFDAGSVEYYFASPDKSQIIKGTLTAAYILEGNLASGDATGELQLAPELEVILGYQQWIGNDWTIHAGYPTTDANQIGVVTAVDSDEVVGMKYNALPTQQQVRDNHSRYQFITENFYGDPNLNSMYGVHGLERAFAYNGEFFYKIYTQPDASKDMPRSLANHHTHLALGYHGGRVDISVVGEPYNFDGRLGASSWAFGDKVVGLLPLSGTILGVFGAKSIWGISGTTVDNFATQVISPNIGATEYTITDMGFPVYANAYGIYTLSQTQQYGDYLGQPMSQDISPWLRPRLLRKTTSNKEVVCAWPVRSKNQYRLAFSDGYVTSMTLNGQQVPTFSFQKYFYTPSDPPTTMEWVVVDDFTDSIGGAQ